MHLFLHEPGDKNVLPLPDSLLETLLLGLSNLYFVAIDVDNLFCSHQVTTCFNCIVREMVLYVHVCPALPMIVDVLSAVVVWRFLRY